MSDNGVVDYHGLFLVPLTLGLIATGLLLLFFWPPKKESRCPRRWSSSFRRVRREDAPSWLSCRLGIAVVARRSPTDAPH